MGAGAGAGQELQSTSTTPKHPCNNKSQMFVQNTQDCTVTQLLGSDPFERKTC
jgi:hypothetical protein